MTTDNSRQHDAALGRWQSELIALLEEIETAQAPDALADVLARVARLDPDLQRFLVDRMAEQESGEAAAFLSALASHPATPATTRKQAQGALAALAERGVGVPATGAETFFTGWVQQSRERGEQIMFLGWRLPDGQLEALVFLLDWRGDGLKDFYRTREMSDDEWRQLVEHNADKGAPLTEISLADGRALLEDALEESRRFSRPVPREYRLAQGLVARRILDASALPAARRQYVAPDLAPAMVVEAYVQALHFRDYALVWELLAPEHPTRALGRADGLDVLRREIKRGPRRLPDARVTLESASAAPAGDEVSALVEGQEESVERGGRRVRRPVRERYDLRRTADGWRIGAVAALTA